MAKQWPHPLDPEPGRLGRAAIWTAAALLLPVQAYGLYLTGGTFWSMAVKATTVLLGSP